MLIHACLILSQQVQALQKKFHVFCFFHTKVVKPELLQKGISPRSAVQITQLWGMFTLQGLYFKGIKQVKTEG